MLEPRPSRISPPHDQQPILRAGIVLKEDVKPMVRFSVPTEGFKAESKSDSVPLTPGMQYFVHTSGSRLVIQDEKSECFFECAAGPIKLTPPLSDQSALMPQSGISVDSIVAGRNFHWRKEVTQTLPGSLEIFREGECVVVVNQVAFEDYITCVISSEMGSACPREFIKAQAVAARSWALAFLSHKHTGAPFTICNDDCCQRYQGTTYLSDDVIEAVRECCGDFLVAEDGFVCAAYYSKSCGGHTDLPANIMGFEVPGLKGVTDKAQVQQEPNLTSEAQFRQWLDRTHPEQQGIFCSPDSIKGSDLRKYLGAVDERGAYYRWESSTSHTDLITLLRDRAGIPDIEEVVDLVPGPRGVSGRILNLKVLYKNTSGETREHRIADSYDLRLSLHKSFLLSSAFVHECVRDAAGRLESVNFRGCGWGHGVGMCQIGAVGMAVKGHSYRQILSHYYPGAKLVKAY